MNVPASQQGCRKGKASDRLSTVEASKRATRLASVLSPLRTIGNRLCPMILT